MEGVGETSFSREIVAALMKPIDLDDIEIKPGMYICFDILSSNRKKKKKRFFTQTPGFVTTFIFKDGMIYLPEIKYRRILNKAFGPGGTPYLNTTCTLTYI